MTAIKKNNCTFRDNYESYFISAVKRQSRQNRWLSNDPFTLLQQITT